MGYYLLILTVFLCIDGNGFSGSCEKWKMGTCMAIYNTNCTDESINSQYMFFTMQTKEMEISQQPQQHHYQLQPNIFLALNNYDHDLYCNEEHWIVEAQQREQSNIGTDNIEEEHELQLQTLLSKEEEMHFKLSTSYLQADVSFSTTRFEAVQWILSLNSYHGFSAHTGVLSINYLDQFLVSFQFRAVNPRKEWMVHLAAIACLSLAAKVEETHVPLLNDLQVENSNHVFQPRTIQKMELMVLSMLDWKMNSATPFSFVNHIISRLHLVNHKHMEFFTLFKDSLLSFITDSRYVHYRPSIIAATITCNVLKQMNFGGHRIDYLKNQLYDTLQFSKEKFKECYQLIRTSKPNNGFIANHVLNHTSTSATGTS